MGKNKGPKKEGKRGTVKIRHECPNPYMDAKYGRNVRVANHCGNNYVRCCGCAERIIKV